MPVGAVTNLFCDFLLCLIGVCGFLDGQVVPQALVLVVGPGDHVLRELVLTFRDTIQDSVDGRHGLGPGDVLIRPEGAVIIALDPAQSCSPFDVCLGPVSFDVAESVYPLHFAVVKVCADHSQYRFRLPWCSSLRKCNLCG